MKKVNRYTDTLKWKDSQDRVERMCYWINWLSPWNLWKAKEPLQKMLDDTREEERKRIEKLLKMHLKEKH